MLSDFIHYFMFISPISHTGELKLREIRNPSNVTPESGKAEKRTWAVRQQRLSCEPLYPAFSLQYLLVYVRYFKQRLK